MMKSKKILIVILTLIAILLVGTIKVQAASAEIYASKTTVEVGEDVTITAKFTAAAWNIKVSGNGISGASYASQTSDLSEAENAKEFKLDTSKAGKYTIIISGDITDTNGETKEINKSCTVTVNEKKVTPTPEPDPEPETPAVEEKPNFKDAKKTMYASKDMYLRASWSTESAGTKITKGTELTVTATSNNTVNKYVWYKVTYNGKIFYAASNLLTATKPEETTAEEPNTENPTEDPVEEPTTNDVSENNEVKEGLKSLEIEGITLSPAFSPDVYEYRAIIKKDVSELTINAVAASEEATVTIAGNKNLQEGENLIIIVVYNANSEVEATYQITANKSTLDLTDTDNLLKAGTQSAKRNLIIFISVLAVAIIVLIVVMILKHRNEYYEDDYEEDDEYDEDYSEEKFTNSEETVEKVEEETAEEEKGKGKKEKRKGKHF